MKLSAPESVGVVRKVWLKEGVIVGGIGLGKVCVGESDPVWALY